MIDPSQTNALIYIASAVIMVVALGVAIPGIIEDIRGNRERAEADRDSGPDGVSDAAKAGAVGSQRSPRDVLRQGERPVARVFQQPVDTL